MRILSCIPVQLTTVTEKLEWMDRVATIHHPDIFVTPQEYFGGAVIMLNNKSFLFSELAPALQQLCNKHQMALIVGVVEKTSIDGRMCNRESIWFFEKDGSFIGSLYKMALPKYDHVSTNGFGEIVPEVEFENRFRVFDLCGLRVSAIFCWEVYSNILWSGLALEQPDIIFSLIKFGVNAWPTVTKDETTGLNTVVGFGYGGWSDCDWVERLFVANKWQVKCPIICSTNSWNLRPISLPLCGTISTIPGQAEHSFWHPMREDKCKTIPEKIIVDEIDVNKIRMSLENKFLYKDLVGEFPPFSLGKYTMMLKINRFEKRVLSGREQSSVSKKLSATKKHDGGFGLI